MSHDMDAGIAAAEPTNSRLTSNAALVARYALVIVLLWFGGMKFTYFETHNISAVVANSPLISWFYDIMSIRAFGRVLGPLEIITAALIALKPWYPKVSILGGLLAVFFFLGTLTTMFSTPGVAEASAGGFPVLSANGQFLMKDIALLGLSIWLLADSIDATRRQATLTKRTGLSAVHAPR